MAGEPHALAVEADGQPEAVTVGDGIGFAGERLRGGVDAGGLGRRMHFADRGAAHGTGVGVVARGPSREVESDVAREILGGGEEAAHRAVGPVAFEGLEFPRVVFPAVAEGEAVGRDRGEFPVRVRHAERAENFAGDVALIGYAGNARDDAAEEGETEVAVFEGDAG